MTLTRDEDVRGRRRLMRCWIALAVLMLAVSGAAANAQAVSTTTVQGTVYLANGQPGGGTLAVSWPAFTTAAGQAIAADSLTVTIPADGFVSVNLAPNQGATPAGEYYTAVYYMSDGSTSTEYWVVPAGAQATLAQVRAQVMPAAQAVQAVSKAYVDQSISELTESLLTASGGNLSGPLYLNGDPTQPLQAADMHFVETQVATTVPLNGGNMTGALTTPALNGVQAPAASSAQTTLQAAMNAAGTNGAMQIPPAYAGTDTFTNPNGVPVTDLRTGAAQQAERSVKEFGAVCDGVTDDTNALQAALNYANAHGVALTLPQGTCKTQSLNWHGESIGGMGKQVSALMGFPGQDVLASAADSPNVLSYTRLHDLTIYVDQSVDVSCSAAEGRAAAGSCQIARAMETNSIFSLHGNGLTNTVGTGAAWSVGNCAIAMPASTGLGGNGLKVAEIENVEIATVGIDPMAAQYPGAHSTHTCGIYLAQWPQWSEFRNIDIRGLSTGVAIPALPVTTPAWLNADSNRWQNVTIQATHAFTAAAGSNNVLDNIVALAGNSSATGEPPTGLVLDFAGNQQGWTVRNAVVMPLWNAVPPALTVTAAGGAVTAVSVGPEHGLGWDPYGTTVPLKFSGSCTAQATAAVNSDGSIGAVTVTQGGVGCSATTMASVNAAGTWDTAAPLNLVSGQNMTFFAGNLLKGNGGYTVWNASGSASYGTQLDGGGGTLPGGGAYSALVGNSQPGATYAVDQFSGVDFGGKLQACVNAVSASYGGTCDARNFTGNQAMSANLTISTANTTVLLPCATISTANQIVVTAGARNVALRGCALRGGSLTSGSQGGTAIAYSGASAVIRVGDPTYAVDTPGFHLDNVVMNSTGSTSASAQGLAAYRTQEMDVESVYFLGNANQTAMTLDGTGNYTGGTFLDDQIDGFETAVNAIGHQVANPATTDWMNASSFVRLHIDCPTSNGNPIAGTYGINLQQGDGNTFTGGDVEGCATALHLGENAQNNTIVGLRNENSTNQVVADAGSSYNSWMTGGTMFTGQLTDNGTRNSFLDTFHRSFNGLNGDWYGSQQDATLTNHYRLGIGLGNERGLLNRYQTDYGYRWTMGLSDATGGEQFYQLLDELNNVYRLSIGQYNNGQSSTNNQTVINSAGTGAVVLNGSNNSGTGGVTIGSGGASETTVATISNAGNAQFNGTLQVGGATQSAGTLTVRNNADAEVDYYLWPGLTTSQKGSFTYKDWNGNSQWFMLKDANDNWALNSAVGGLDSFKAYQSTNSGDTYIDASNASGVVRVNYETGAGTGFKVYGGNSSAVYASFTGTSSIEFPGLAASSGYNCLQVDTSGYITNTGSACGSGSGSDGSGSVNSSNAGYIAYYTASGSTLSGMSTVPLTAGGTGATTAPAALASLGGFPLAGGTLTGALNGTNADFSGTATAGTLEAQNLSSIGPRYDVTQFGAAGNGTTDDTAAIQAAFTACYNGGGGTVEFPGPRQYVISSTINAFDTCNIEGQQAYEATIGNGRSVEISWNGPAAGSLTATSTQTVIQANSPALTVASSTNSASWGAYASQVVVTASNSFSANQWVMFSGCASGGLNLNNLVGQITASNLSSSTFTVLTQANLTYGTYTNSCTITEINVAIAYDAFARFQQKISSIFLRQAAALPTSNYYGVGIFYAQRVDTGTGSSNVALEDPLYFGWYYADGGINTYINEGSRSDGFGLAAIYWRISGSDNLGISDSVIAPNADVDGYAGANIMVDNEACVTGAGLSLSLRNTNLGTNANLSINPSLIPNLDPGIITLIDCPADNEVPQLMLDMEGSTIRTPASITYAPGIVVSPPNDNALQLDISNGTITEIGGVYVVGVPALARNFVSGADGYIPHLSYSPDFLAQGRTSGSAGSLVSLTQSLTDLNIMQLWQYATQASAWLESDTAFAALPGGTTLYKGQVLAPPAYFQCGTGSGCGRYAADVVQATGTTGTLNGGSTTCSAPGGTSEITCSSAAGLSPGQWVVLGSNSAKQILYIDATNSSAVLVALNGNESEEPSGTGLSYLAPVLGDEIQLLTKASAAPTTGTWVQGDYVENSGATAGGTAGWVNVAGGTPGIWAAVPLGNSGGLLLDSQIYDAGGQSTSPVCPNGTGGALTTSGCAGGGGAPANTPAWLQYLGSGADGAESCNGSLSGDHYYTTFTVSASDTCTVNSSAGLVIHATGACTINGTISATGAAASNADPPSVGSGGGGGGGTAAGTAGMANYYVPGVNTAASVSSGTAGAASGGAGGAGNQPSSTVWRALLDNGIEDGLYWDGAAGGAGGSSGGAGGYGGYSVILICASITGSGTINTSGEAGTNASANDTGAGGGGAAGPIILSSQAPETFGITLKQTAGVGGTCGSYTGCGAGGAGAAGQYAEFSGW